ncbi:Hypothetical protein HVR_LOCUS1000 [uncultured virus]|nr:Hypothetical protein HVR_LOCUS1000 [uncultured virus]
MDSGVHLIPLTERSNYIPDSDTIRLDRCPNSAMVYLNHSFGGGSFRLPEEAKLLLGEVRFTFGKYNGNSIEQVYNMDKGYLYWCIKTPGIIRKYFRITDAIRNYIRNKKNNHRKLELKIISIPN